MAALSVKSSYAVLENMVFQGFDTVGVNLYGHSIVLRTLFPSEETVMSLETMSMHSADSSRFLAYSTLFVDGESTLRDRESSLVALKAMYSSFPAPLTRHLLEKLMVLRTRANSAMMLLEGFCHTYSSRRKWRCLGRGMLPHSLSPVPGTLELGLNAVQEQWVSYNVFLDEEALNDDNSRRDVFVVSGFNSKGAEKISNSMDSQRKNREERISVVRMFGSLDNHDAMHGKKKVNQWAKKLHTRKDIEKEIDKLAKGEKDKHDLLVESYFEWLAEDARKAQEREEAKRAEQRKARPQTRNFQGQAAVSREEMEAAIRGEKDIRDIVGGRETFGAKSTVGRRVIKADGSRVGRA